MTSSPAFRMRRLLVTGTALAGVSLLALAPTAGAATQGATIGVSPVSPQTGGGFGVYNFTVSHGGSTAFPFSVGTKRGHCVERLESAAPGAATLKSDADVALNPQPTSADQVNRIAWLTRSSIHTQDTTGASALTPGQSAAAHQSAIWQFTDPGVASAISADPVVAAEATRLMGEAEANKGAAQQAPAMIVTGASSDCGAGSRTVRVSGAPFTTAELSIGTANGAFPGGVSSVSLDLGSDGAATTTVTGAVGTIAVNATVSQAKLVHVDFAESQDFAYTELTPVPVSLNVVLPPCTTPAPQAPTGTPTTAPTTPTTEVTQTPQAVLRISKRGPRRILSGRRMTYVITVRNTSRTTARNVVIRDTLPRGMVLARRAAGMSLSGRTVGIRIGSIGPRRAITRRVVVSVLRETRGRRCNRAIVRASNAPTRGARTCTVVRLAPRRVAPAVTG